VVWRDPWVRPIGVKGEVGVFLKPELQGFQLRIFTCFGFENRPSKFRFGIRFSLRDPESESLEDNGLRFRPSGTADPTGPSGLNKIQRGREPGRPPSRGFRRPCSKRSAAGSFWRVSEQPLLGTWRPDEARGWSRGQIIDLSSKTAAGHFIEQPGTGHRGIQRGRLAPAQRMRIKLVAMLAAVSIDEAWIQQRRSPPPGPVDGQASIRLTVPSISQRRQPR